MNKNNKLFRKIIFIILLIILYIFLNKFLFTKIKNYESLISKKRNELLLSQNYKKDYLKLQNNYNYFDFSKDEIIQKVNKMINNNNLDVLKMKTKDDDKKLFIIFDISGDFYDINNFFYDLDDMQTFSQLNNFQINALEKSNNDLLVKMEIEFLFSGLKKDIKISNSNKNAIQNIHNPFQETIDVTYYNLKTENKKIKVELPIKLKGIIGDNKNKLAIIEINNKMEIINKDYKNNKLEIIDINSDNLLLKYEDLLFLLKLGGNKGVMQ